MEKKWNLRKGCMLALAIYMILAVLFYMIAGQQLRVRADSTDSVSPSVSVGEILSDMRLESRVCGFCAACTIGCPPFLFFASADFQYMQRAQKG